jgi:hypothetical protein
MEPDRPTNTPEIEVTSDEVIIQRRGFDARELLRRVADQLEAKESRFEGDISAEHAYLAALGAIADAIKEALKDSSQG